MKIRIIILFILAFITLKAQDYVSVDFNTPKVTSKYHYSLLQKQKEDKIPTLLSFHPNTFLFDKAYDDYKSFMYYKTKNAYIASKYKLGVSHSADKGDYQYFYGAEIFGNISDKIFIYSDWWKVQFPNDIKNPDTPLMDSWTEKNAIDNSRTVISYKNKNLSLSVGRSKYQIGSNISGSVILSDVSNDYGYFSSKFNIGKVGISFIHASVIPDSINPDYNSVGSFSKKYEDKYFVLHKIDWNGDNLHIFIGETVVYGSRSIDVNYLLPIAFLRAIEHDLADRDNAFMFGGFDWTFKEHNTLYLNVNIDDLSKATIFTSFWGNKYAAQLGYQKRIKKLILTNETTAVRPWMYTHKRLVNKFSNDKMPLGYPNGSNIIQNSTEVSYDFSKKLQVAAYYGIAKQGSEGNNFSINYLQIHDLAGAKCKWLNGDISLLQNIKLSADWTFLNYNRLHIALEYNKKDDEKNTELSIEYQIKI